MSRRRRSVLRLETFEDRTVPAVSLGLTITGGSGNNFAPPDTDGTIGPNHYVQFINGRFAIYNKTTGAQISAVSDVSFWNSAGISSSITNQGTSDTRIMYDPLSSRWFAVEINTANTGNLIMVARSNTNDPTAGWKATSFGLNPNNFADYPTLGVDFNAVYIGINDFPAAANVSEAITSIPKADLLLATPTVANRTTLEQDTSGVTIGETPQGVNNFNAGQTSSSPGSIFAADYNSFGFVDRTTVTGAGGAGATFGASSTLSVQATSAPSLAHQPDGTADIDALDGRIQSSVFQVGDLIVGSLATTVGGLDGIRLTVMSDSGNSIVTEATISDGTFDYIDPSVAMNAEGDMIIGFTRSSATLGSGATSGRLGAYAEYAHIDPNNPAAGITFGPVVQVQIGQVSNYHLFGGAGERWGDFSATDVDPNNPTAFWTTQEYAVGSGTWGTKIGQVFVSPRVSRSAGVSSTAANGTYTTGQVIPITVKFNDAVTVTGTPQLALNAGGGALATYASGTGTNTLTFNYTVALGQASAHLDYSSATALTLNGGTIKDTASGLDAILNLATPGAAGSLSANTNIVIDTTPRITGGVSATNANGTYGTGNVIHVTVAFSSPVAVTGTPSLALNASGTAAALFVSGSGTATLTFDYTVAAADASAHLDYTSTTALTLNGGTIKDASNSNLNAILTLAAPGAAGSLGANKNIVIDTSTATPSNVTSTTANGTYGSGTVIPITIAFTRSVDVTTGGGTPTLALNSGGTATYVSGTGTTTLTFNYTVALGDTTNGQNLDYASTTALALSGGTIKDHLNGADAILTLPAPGTAGSLGANKSIVIDATVAKPSNITSTNADGNYGFGQAIAITVAFTKIVTVTGTPKLDLNSGGTASYASGSGSTTLTFSYTVGLTDVSAHLDYTSTSALTLNGGTITDQANAVPATLTLPAVGAAGSLGANKNLVVDGTPAKPFNVTSSLANGAYGVNAVIPITVSFTKSVIVSVAGGTPTLTLNSGGTATYTGGNGTFTTLTFSYTVAAGQNSADLDYTSTSALALNGATITDLASSTAATLTLPAPAAAGSLGANKNLVVDTMGPTVVAYKVLFGSKSYNLIGSTRFDVPWDITGIQVVFNKVVVSGNIHSLTGLTATQLTGLGSKTLTFKFPGIVHGEFNTGLASSGSNALKDAAGNSIIAFSHALNVLYGDFNDDQVVNAADETGVRSFVPPPFTLNPPYSIFADLSGDGIINLVDVNIAHSRRGTSLP